MLQIFGSVDMPPGVEKYGILQAGGLISFLSNIIKLISIGAGIFSLVNLVLAGLGFIGSSGDPKKTAAAWEKIWMSLIGLLIIVSSFVLAAIIGYIIFGSVNAILIPQIYGPDLGPAAPPVHPPGGGP
ncbi:hypothetical protein KKD62_02970 [Patescibacteria group bacterium]|nr:hypothetical protein [Patescibacteria group bacterium]